MRTARLLLAAVLGLVVVGTSTAVPGGPARADPNVIADPRPPAASPEAPDEGSGLALDRVLRPEDALGPGWQDSTDRAVTTAGDHAGLHVLVADRRDAYQWRTAATLAEPLVQSDQWIGQLCVSGSGRRALVVYAPRQFANRPELMAAGAFAAVVDLDTGTVRKLPERVTLAYYNPSCGTGETALLSRLEHREDAPGPAHTWIGTVNLAKGRITATTRPAGQLTSATLVAGRTIAAKGNALVEVAAAGAVTALARTAGAPFRLMPDGPDALAFQIARGRETDLARLASGRVRTIGTVPLGQVKLRPGAGGAVYAIGGRSTELLTGDLPGAWAPVDAPPDSEVSTGGGLVVIRALTLREAAGRTSLAAPATGPGAHTVRIDAVLTGPGSESAEVDFAVPPAAGPAGRQLSPALAAAAPAPTPGPTPQTHTPATTPWDPDRACAVPRNDPAIQVYQPSPEQVEWAANLAVRGQLTFQRPANWLNNGLPGYSPQSMFPSLPLSGGGNVPAQILLGILAQESNLWQASWHVVDALAGNPMTSSGFYGIHWENPDPTTINWSNKDCGYGVAQVTTGMTAAETGTVVDGVTMDYTKQRAVALDYATNAAAGLRILQSKWNETRSAGLVANNGDPRYLENWWFALWAYNTGFYPNSGPFSPWGLGWSNNPASPLYPADRQMFLTAPLDVPAEYIDDEVGYDNAKHPNHWSYPERVIGFAYTSLRRFDFEHQYWGPTYLPAEFRVDVTPAAQPGRLTFCSAGNDCDAAAPPHVPADYPGYPPGPCQRDDLKCWWHAPAAWTDCPTTCGVEDRRFTTVEPRPFASSIYSGQCALDGLPAGARVIDDIDSAVALGPEGCPRTWTRGGQFDLEFRSMTGQQGAPIYPGKVDFHQIGGGFGGHFWFAHTIADDSSVLKVTGKWTPSSRFNGWVRVMAHLPDHGAHTQQAHYRIHTGAGAPRDRYVPTRRMENAWVTLGTYQFSNAGAQWVELSNITEDGRGVDDVAWDAVAFVPLPDRPRHMVVAIGDSYGSGEGVGNYYPETDTNYGDLGWNACRRSRDAYPYRLTLPGSATQLRDRLANHDPDVDFQFVSCSGATADEMMATTAPGYWQNPRGFAYHVIDAEGNFGEMQQIRSGVLSGDTTLVLLSTGGNDAGFPETISYCGESTCASAAYEAQVRGRIDLAVIEARTLIGNIRAQAANATILLVGYPRLFQGIADSFCAFGLFFGEMSMLNDLADYFDTRYRDMVNDLRATGANVGFVSMIGMGGACPAVPTTTAHIHHVVTGPTGDGDFRDIPGVTARSCPLPSINLCVSRSSFHPKPSAMGVYATTVAQTLQDLQYEGWP